MRILITGGAGFLGCNLAAHALLRGDEVLVFDNLSRVGASDNLTWLRGKGPFQFIHGDIRNAEDVASALGTARPAAVFHLAGQVAMTTSIGSPRRDFEINALGTINVLEGMRCHAPEAVVIYSSTNKVYGDLTQYQYRETPTRYECVDRPRGFDESTPLDFHSPYGCSKGCADQYMLDYARIFKLRTIVFRHSSMYGGRQFSTYDQGWIGWFCQQAVAIQCGSLNQPFTISGNGKQVRDVLHAKDMISLYYSAVEHAEQAQGHAFNIGGGMPNSLSLLELFTLLEGELTIRMTYQKLPPRESDQRVFVADISKARTLLGWAPQVTPEHGLRDMLEWVRHADMQ